MHLNFPTVQTMNLFCVASQAPITVHISTICSWSLSICAGTHTHTHCDSFTIEANKRNVNTLTTPFARICLFNIDSVLFFNTTNAALCPWRKRENNKKEENEELKREDFF